MSKVPCYTVGRDASVAITLQHETVSRRHAELIPVPDGQIYITDCASTNGTFIDENGQWRKITQDFVSAGGRVRFGEVEVSVQRLLAEISRLGVNRSEGDAGPSNVKQEEQLDASQGVARNPYTGEPIALDETD